MSIERLNSRFNQSILKAHQSQSQASKAATARQPETQREQRLNFNQIGAQTLSLSLQKALIIGKDNHFKEVDVMPQQEIKPFEFDFEEVARNVMGFVSGYVETMQAGGASDEELKALMAQARAGIDSGFEMARDELSSIDVLGPELEEGINKSYDLIQEGMNSLDEKLFSKPQDTSQGLGVSGRQQVYRESERTSLNLTTVEGDEIELIFSSSHHSGFEASEQRNAAQINASREFSLKINGDISDKEQAAIASLVKDITHLADSFFNGDVETAWQQAQGLGYDDSQIAGFALQLKEVKQVQITRQYAGVAELADKARSNQESPLANVAGYLNDLKSVDQQAAHILPGSDLSQLTDEIVNSGFDFSAALQVERQQHFNQFNQRLLDAIA